MALYHTVILQAEGAIEGEADMYEVASPYETTFAFSRFDAAERKFTPDERLAAAEASATDRELPERRGAARCRQWRTSYVTCPCMSSVGSFTCTGARFAGL